MEKAKNVKNTPAAEKPGKKRINPIILIIAVGLAIVIVLGAVLVTVNIVNEVNSVVAFNGVYVSRGVASYLAATYKYEHIKMLNRTVGDSVDVKDSMSFWNSEISDGVTYGDELISAAENYIRGVVIGSYLFDSTSSLTSAERKYIDDGINEVLDYKAGGNQSIFNDECQKMGFTFSDFRTATEMMYKASMLKSVLYGTSGSYLENGGNDEGTEEFLGTYSHVKLLSIRLIDDYVLGEDGKPMIEQGRYVMRSLTDEEFRHRSEDIARIRELIRGYESDADLQMSPEAFTSYQNKYVPFDDYISTGYYFASTAAYSGAFEEEYGEVLMSKIYEMEVDSYAEVVDGNVVCFIYKYAPEPYAYNLSKLSSFFGDFFSDCANYLYTKLLDANKEKVNVKDGYREIDVLALPYNYKFIAG